MNLSDVLKNTEGLYEGNLIYYFRILMKNARNLTNPYHNFRHMLHVVWMCYNACQFYKGVLSPREMRNLLIAAMFHDFDHSGRSGHDDLEIERAVRALIRYLLPEDKPFEHEIVWLMRSTQYPHTIADNDLTLSGQILRDADLSQSMSNAWILQVIFGLAAESNIEPIEMLRREIGFHCNLALITDWAKTVIKASDIQAKIDETHALIEMLDA